MTSEQHGRSEERISSDDPELRALAQEIADDATDRLREPPQDAGDRTTQKAAEPTGRDGPGGPARAEGDDGPANSEAPSAPAATGAHTEDRSEGAERDGFSLLKAFGGWGALLDAGLPGVAFVVTYTAFGQNLRLALLVAIALGGLFAVIRLWRKDPLQNVVGGFIAVAVAAAIANATGRAEDFYLPGLIINAVYLVGWGVANLFRYPLIGVVIGLGAGWGFEWRKDPKLMRAFLLAGWVWVSFFALRLAVQVPLYFNEELGKIAVARILMGWPLWLVVLGASYLVIKATVPQESWVAVRRAAAQLAERGSPLARPENLEKVRTEVADEDQPSETTRSAEPPEQTVEQADDRPGDQPGEPSTERVGSRDTEGHGPSGEASSAGR